MAPLGWLSFDVASNMIVAVSSLAFIIGVACSCLSTGSTMAAAVALLGFALSDPLPAELGLANTDLIAAGSYGFVVLMLQRRRAAAAGIALGLGLSLKPTMLLLFLLPVVVGQWRVSIVAGLVVATINLAGMALVPDASRFFTSALPFIGGGATSGYNVSLKAALDRFEVLPAVVTATRALIAVAVVMLVVHTRRALADAPALAALVLIVATPLVSSYFFSVYFVYLVAASGAIALFTRTRDVVLLSVAAFLMLASFVLRSANATLDDLSGLRWVIAAVVVLAAVLSAARGQVSREGRRVASSTRR